MGKVSGFRVQGSGFRKILIVRLDRIGDVVLSTPAIKAVREAYPDSHIAFMVRPYCRDVVEGNPYLNEVIIYDKEGKEKPLAGNLNFIRMLREKKFDLAIILHPTVRTHLVAALAGIPERAGYDRKWGFLLTKRLPHTKQFGLKHEIDYTLDILRHLGIEAKDRTLYMPVDRQSERKAEEIFAESGIKEKERVIAVNPSASCPSKRWPPERFAEVADRLAERYGARTVIISDSKDKAFSGRAASAMSHGCLDLSGRTTVADVASVLRRAKLFISNDSGPVHIACAVGTPVVAIFGRSDKGLSPKRWGPVGKRDIVLHKDVGCEKCLAHNCKIGFRCLEAVTVEDVLSAAERILDEEGATGL